MFPAGKLCGREGRVQARAGGEDPEAVRADQPRAVRPHPREQLVLAADAVDAGLGEARGDHAEGARALRHRRLGLGEHRVAGHAEDGEVDDVGTSAIEA